MAPQPLAHGTLRSDIGNTEDPTLGSSTFRPHMPMHILTFFAGYLGYICCGHLILSGWFSKKKKGKNLWHMSSPSLPQCFGSK